MFEKARNSQRQSLSNILLRVSESFAHLLELVPKSLSLMIDDFYHWLVLGDIITWVHLCVATVTTLHHIYHIICYQLQRHLYQVLGIIIISTCQKLCRVFVPKASVLFAYFSLRYRPRKIMRCFLLNETNQNKAVAMRTTRIVRQVSFVNTSSLTYFFFYVIFFFFVFFFFVCVCAIPRKWLQMMSNHVVIIGKRKQVIQSSERLQ